MIFRSPAIRALLKSMEYVSIWLFYSHGISIVIVKYFDPSKETGYRESSSLVQRSSIEHTRAESIDTDFHFFNDSEEEGTNRGHPGNGKNGIKKTAERRLLC